MTALARIPGSRANAARGVESKPPVRLKALKGKNAGNLRPCRLIEAGRGSSRAGSSAPTPAHIFLRLQVFGWLEEGVAAFLSVVSPRKPQVSRRREERGGASTRSRGVPLSTVAVTRTPS